MTDNEMGEPRVVFYALGNPIRFSLFCRLKIEGELTVSELCEPFAVTPSAITRHIDVLVDAKLAKRRRDSRFQYVSIDHDGLASALYFIELALQPLATETDWEQPSMCHS